MNSFDYENGFYLSCSINRMSKLIAHYELYKKTLEIQGAFIECGVFKGASLSRFIMFREILEKNKKRKFLGFDSFGDFPETNFEPDKKQREEFIKSAGQNSISIEKMRRALKQKGCDNNIELVKGNICETVPKYVKNNPSLQIAFLNLDTDIYEPAVIILEYLWPRIAKGGVLVSDNYGSFLGETKAIDDYFRDKLVTIQQCLLHKGISYIVKDK